MKKILTLVLCLCMMLTMVTVFASCSGEAEYKLGMGVVVSMDSSSTGNAQVDATVATVVTDAEGKIVMCRIDVAQNKMAVADGAVNTAATFKTKMEKGPEYGMAGKVDNDDNGVMLEWDAQAKAFEEYVVGKTAAEVKAMTTQEKKGHQITTDQALLDAGCSMQITDFIAAVVKACNDDQGMSFTAEEGTFTLGVAAKTVVDSATKAAAEDADGVVAMYTDFAAAVVADGKIVAALNDAIQPKITMNVAGEITAKTFKDTKRVLKGEYGMAGKVDNNDDGVMKEWFEQSAAFSAHVVGMTADEVAAMTTVAAKGHDISTDANLLAAGCSMQITGIKAVVSQAAKNAR